LSSAALRIFIFTLLPLLLGGGAILLDRTATSRERRLEVVLILLFALAVAGSGIFSAFSHLFLSDLVAESIGWSTGSPFQLEVGFANLAIGALGLIAVARRDGFREATVVAVTVFALGATVVHLMDVLDTGNLAPGNSLQNVGNLLRPALLIGFLVASRRAEASPHSETSSPGFAEWRRPWLQASGPMTASVATAYGLGFAIGNPWVGALVGSLTAGAILAFTWIRSPAHISV
jgi:4-amino-4-deoxy-L-arabinose transferase-like glycosyltransferase